MISERDLLEMTVEERLERLEFRDSVMATMFGGRRNHFGEFVLFKDLDAEQKSGLWKVMEDLNESVQTRHPMSRLEFEKRILPFVPLSHRSGSTIMHHFQRELIWSVASWNSGFEPSYEHFKREYNLPTLADD